ncbi:MAG: sulfite exporter TauE/SafE family protein [Ilumatobacteraceae bacterium]
MSSRDRLLLLVVGLGAGFLSGVFGVGGGILVVPGLMMFVRMEQRRAHGTSLAAVLPIAVASLVTYWAHDHVDWPVALWLSIGALAGAFVGASLLAIISKRNLALVFAIVLAIVGIRLFFTVSGDGRGEITVLVALAYVLLGLVTGALSGLLGIGGGAIMVPIMAVLFGIPSVIAKGTSLAVIIPTALMGTVRNRSNANVDMTAAVVVGVTGVVMAVVGAWVSARMSDAVSNALFAVLLIAVAVRMLRQAWKETTSARGQ